MGSDDWPEVRLGDLVDERGISYGIVQPGPACRDGVPIVRVNNMRDGRIATDDIKQVAADIEAKYGRTRLLGGEVLISVVGSLGQIAVVPPSLRGWNIARAVAMIPVRDDIGADWIAYALRSAGLQHRMRTRATTTVQATLNLQDVRELPIPLPRRLERERVTALLRALDDRIELNRHMNLTLQSIIRTIFKSWFVDFDPVSEKGLGDEVGEPPTLAALSPTPVHDVVDVIYGAPFASELFTTRGGRPLLRIRDLGAQNPGVLTNEEHPKETLVIPGGIVAGMDGEFRAHLWCGPPSLLNQRVCLFRPKLGVPRAYVIESLRAPLAEIERSKTGTTVIHLSKSDIDRFEFPPSTPEVLSAFAHATEHLVDLVITNARETRTLADLRDLLIGPLVTGRRVSAAQDVLEASR